MGGVTNLRHHFAALGAEPDPPRVVGLYDIGEFAVVRRMLDEAGRGRPADVAEAESLGFFACSLDLEDELIRAAGVDLVETVLAEIGELRDSGRSRGSPHSAAARSRRSSDASPEPRAGGRSGSAARSSSGSRSNACPRQLVALLRAAAPR